MSEITMNPGNTLDDAVTIGVPMLLSNELIFQSIEVLGLHRVAELLEEFYENTGEEPSRYLPIVLDDDDDDGDDDGNEIEGDEDYDGCDGCLTQCLYFSGAYDANFSAMLQSLAAMVHDYDEIADLCDCDACMCDPFEDEEEEEEEGEDAGDAGTPTGDGNVPTGDGNVPTGSPE